MIDLKKYDRIEFLLDMTEILEFAEKVGKEENLENVLRVINQRTENINGTCKIYKDFAPYSMGFARYYEDGRPAIVGGIIYHGQHDKGGDGGPPTFSVNLSPEDGWVTHT